MVGMDTRLPPGLIELSELGIMSEVGTLDESSNLYQLAETVIRATGVIIRYAAKQPGWTSENVPLEARVIALDFARRVFNNPQVQQRIQTGPLGESYSPEELTGLALKESEEELLATFVDGAEGDLGSLSVISVVRPDRLEPPSNRILAYMIGLGRNDAKVSLPSLAAYLGVEGPEDR